jgi:hypothetical protein
VSVKLQFAMQESLAIRRHHLVPLVGAKGGFIKIDRGWPVADYQMGNELVFAIHFSSWSDSISRRFLERDRCYLEEQG